MTAGSVHIHQPYINLTVISVMAQSQCGGPHTDGPASFCCSLICIETLLLFHILTTNVWLLDLYTGQYYKYPCIVFLFLLFLVNLACGNCILSNTMNRLTFENHADIATSRKHDCFSNVERHRDYIVTYFKRIW